MMLNGPVYPIPDNPRLRLGSLGLGVQSTTLLLMCAHGEFDVVPDIWIFSDTVAEPRGVYEHLDWLRSGNVLPPSFKIEVVSAGSLKDEVLSGGEGYGNSWGRPPFYVKKKNGEIGPLRRQCTGDYKIDPIEKKTRELLGLRPGQWWPKEPVVEQWIGLSMDEIIRIKPSKKKAIACRWPLIERGMTREDCKAWLRKNGYPVPQKSACTFCPYHSNSMWRDMKANDPIGFSEAVSEDEAIRGGVAGMKEGECYVHRSGKPLAEVDFEVLTGNDSLDMFGNECEGMCGV